MLRSGPQARDHLLVRTQLGGGISPVRRSAAKRPGRLVGRRESAAPQGVSRVANGERDIKKSGGVLCKRVPVRYAWIREHQDSWPVAVMCRVLKVSTSGFYDWRSRKPSPRSILRDRIARAAAESHAESHQVYGYRRVHTDVVEDHEIPCCDETVRDVMAALV